MKPLASSQIRVQKDRSPLDYYVQRLPIDDINSDCSDNALNLLKDTYDAAYVICYVIASMSNGARIANGSSPSYILLPPFDQAHSGFHLYGIRVTNLSLCLMFTV